MGKPRKAGNRRDNHTAARALAEWSQHGFSRTTEKQIADSYKVATRTLWRWKDALEDDPELSALFRLHIETLITRDWADDLDVALQETISRLRQLIAHSNSLNEVTEAFRALSEIAITREVLSGATDAGAHTGNTAQSRTTAAPAYN